MRIIFTNEYGYLTIIVPAPRVNIERVTGILTSEEYTQLIWDSLPDNAINPRWVDAKEIPSNREFRHAWVDVTPEPTVDIDCDKAKDDKLKNLRYNRDKILLTTDKEFVEKLSKGQDVEDITAAKQMLRDITNPLKAVVTKGKINDEAILAELRILGDVLND